MARSTSSKRKTAWLLGGSVAAVVALTLGIALKGVVVEAIDVMRQKGQGAAVTMENAGPGQNANVPVRAAGAAQGASPAAQAQGGQSTPADSFRVKRVLKIDKPLEHGDYYWDDADVPAGPIVITVDLKAQTLSVFRGGYEIGVAVILYGATDKPSPLGVFPITQKDADHASNLYDNAPMPFMLRLTNDGVAIHGSDVKWGNATHGCIGVPTPFAKKLFAVAKLGDPVIITNGRMMNLG